MKAFSLRLTLSCLMFLSIVSAAKADVDPVICGVGGALVGGVLGHQVGGGSGQDAATAIGAAIGAVGGHSLCKQVNADEARIEKRGQFGSQNCVMTRTVTRDRGGRDVSEAYWCQRGGEWVRMSDAVTIRQIQWQVPGPSPQPIYLPRGIISENRLVRFESEVINSAPFQERATLNFAHELRAEGSTMTLDQVGQILRLAPNDTKRTQMLQSMTFVIDKRYGNVVNALSSFQFEPNRQAALQILMAPLPPSRFSGGGQYR